MKKPKPTWFSIKEAAEYLDVGEPTIYRWMRDKKLTFRKVGDSTRFLQQDLDAIIQVHPAEGDANRAREFCPVCHGTDLTSGNLRSTGLIYFQPDKTKFWTFRDSSIKIKSRMCADCGAIFQFGDTEGLCKIQPDPEKSDN